MPSQSLASLVVDLQMQTANLQRSVDQANSKLGTLDDTVKKIGKSLNILGGMKLGAEVVKGLTEFVMKGADAADKMGKLAQSVGVPVEQLSKLDYAAGLAGLATDELGVAMNKLNLNITAASQGSQKQASAFAALGISVRDATGHVRGAHDVLLDLADRFSKMQDGATKSALAAEFFGNKIGSHLIPLLNQGKAGIEALEAEAERFGLTISSKTAAGAERFNDALDKIHRIANGVAMRVAGELAPAMANLIDKFLNAKGAAETLKMAVQGLSYVMKGLIAFGFIIGAVFEVVGKGIARVASAIVDAASGNFEALTTLNQGIMSDTISATASAIANIKDLFSETKDTMEKPIKPTIDSDAVVKGLSEMAAARAKMESDLAQKSAERGLGEAGRRQAFEDTAPTGGSLISAFREPPEMKRARKGFADFDEAMTRLTASQIGRDRELAEAQFQLKFGTEEAAQFALEAANAHAEVAAAAEEATKAYEDAAKRQAHAVDGLIDHFAAKMGKTGEVIGAAGQGFQAGGWIGAIIAAIAELVAGSKQFAGIIKVLDNFLNALGDAFGSALTSVSEVLAAISPLLQIIVDLVGTIIGLANATHEVDSVFKVLTPIINAIGNAIAPIISLVDMIMQLIDSIGIMDFVIKIVSVVMNIVSLSILGIIYALQQLWGALLDGIYTLMKKFGLNTDLVLKLALDNAKSLAATKDKIDNTWSHIDDPNAAAGKKPIQSIDDVGTAATGAADSLKKLGDTADDVTDQLTNVPTGYKVATARFVSSFAESASGLMNISRSLEEAMDRKSFVNSGSSQAHKNKHGLGGG